MGKPRLMRRMTKTYATGLSQFLFLGIEFFIETTDNFPMAVVQGEKAGHAHVLVNHDTNREAAKNTENKSFF